MKWLNEIYTLVASNKIDDAMDVAFGNFDDLFRAGKFDEADKALDLIDLDKLDIQLMSGVMACTLPAKDKLLRRPAIIEKIRTRLTELVPKRVERLMDRLD